MMTDDKLTTITESTFDPQMRRTMEYLEEKLHRGERTVTVDIHEMLHIISRTVALHHDRQRLEEMLYRTFKGYSDHFNMAVNKVPMMAVTGKGDDAAVEGAKSNTPGKV